MVLLSSIFNTECSLLNHYYANYHKCTMHDMSKTQRENIFARASFPIKSWKMAIVIMDKFEKGTLKGQKLSQKQLVTTPEFKQHLLQPLHHLTEQFQVGVNIRWETIELHCYASMYITVIWKYWR